MRLQLGEMKWNFRENPTTSIVVDNKLKSIHKIKDNQNKNDVYSSLFRFVQALRHKKCVAMLDDTNQSTVAYCCSGTIIFATTGVQNSFFVFKQFQSFRSMHEQFQISKIKLYNTGDILLKLLCQIGSDKHITNVPSSKYTINYILTLILIPQVMEIVISYMWHY